MPAPNLDRTYRRLVHAGAVLSDLEGLAGQAVGKELSEIICGGQPQPAVGCAGILLVAQVVVHRAQNGDGRSGHLDRHQLVPAALGNEDRSLDRVLPGAVLRQQGGPLGQIQQRGLQEVVDRPLCLR
ncbi:MAG: hypothetical protein WKF47_05465 [Geodermatophilaceae bacterium]